MNAETNKEIKTEIKIVYCSAPAFSLKLKNCKKGLLCLIIFLIFLFLFYCYF